MTPEERKGSKLSDWLDTIQRDSWQLELILSGFVIFLLLAGLEPYHQLYDEIDKLSNADDWVQYLDIPYHTFRIAYYSMMIAVMLHVFLRGLWISTIGLRSVSGDIDWEKIRVRGRFDKYLRKEIPSFDSYIMRLETYCSISFSYTFLLFFSILAVGSAVASTILFASIIKSLGLEESGWFGTFLVASYLICTLIYFIDFITLGWLKRIKYFGYVYYPIYRYFGFVTFASLYRPLYYNLIDHKLGRRLAIMVMPIGIAIVVAMSIIFIPDVYVPSELSTHTEQAFLYDSYEDIALEKVTDERPSIRSQVVKDNYLPLFVPYLPTSHDISIKRVCPDLEPGHHTGLKLRGGITAGQIINYKADPEKLLDCMKQLWRVSIDDSLYTDVNFRFYEHPLREQNGLFAMIPIHHLDRSEHFVKIDRHRVQQDSLQWFDGRHIWFYKD